MSRTNKTPGPRCSFCDRTRAEVRALVVGPGASICNLCAVVAVRSLSDDDIRAAIASLVGARSRVPGPYSEKRRHG